MSRQPNSLEEELSTAARKSRSAARWNYFSLLACTWGALLCGAATAALGVFGMVSKEVVSFLALVPGFLALFPATLKFQEKANWHYRKADGIDALIIRLNYLGTPDGADAHRREIAAAYAEMIVEAGRDWERSIIVTAPKEGASAH